MMTRAAFGAHIARVRPPGWRGFYRGPGDYLLVVVDTLGVWLRLHAVRRRILTYGWAEHQRRELVALDRMQSAWDEDLVDVDRMQSARGEDLLIKQIQLSLAIADLQTALADALLGRRGRS